MTDTEKRPAVAATPSPATRDSGTPEAGNRSNGTPETVNATDGAPLSPESADTAPGAAKPEQSHPFRARMAALKKQSAAVFLMLRHPGTPWYARVVAALTVVYALSPVDLIPDFIPVLGYLDDLLILPAMIALTLRLVPGEVRRSCEEQAAGLWENGRPKRWYYAIPVVVLWLAVLAAVLLAVFR